LPHTAQLGVGQFFRKEDWPTILLMKKQTKTRVPQAQNWKPKTTQSRVANKKKKVINAQVQAQTSTKVGYIPRNTFWTNKFPPVSMGTPLHSSVLTTQDLLNFWHNLQNMSQPPIMANAEILDDAEFLLAFITEKLGGNILIDLEELEKFYDEVIQNSGIGGGSMHGFLQSTFQHGIHFDYRQKYLFTKNGSRKPKANINDIIKEDNTEEILQLKALLADGTELRIPRKNFMKAIQEDIQLEVLTEHDEDFVVIRRK
jgi:hypothetical protein